MQQATFVGKRVDDAQEKLGTVAGQAGELKGKADAAKKAAADGAKQAAELKGKVDLPGKAPASAAGGPAPGGATQSMAVAVVEAAPPPPKPARPSDFWVLTPTIAPGDGLTLTLRALPNKPSLASPYALTLESRPIEIAAQTTPPTSDNITVTLGARSALQFWLPWILAALIAVAVIALILFLLKWAGLIRL